ncbi:L,D-transpeptidase family protein [Modestobacter sp. I12A-02628]|uniref:L,D-transpeptidase family protein n=1 Tax=Goekera deserti TaxID=2497753 RepID=A0A7K3WCG0_9ACTN|nr:L,D-transpeptidase family protein [Goekera deserti]MPQ98479.1 L,D-transpeptidase family protein [Goekera deserti]NDI48308.1 L,D-transpeptidase family protein [Goekera deserti]NEL54057.1 L,D-transpeptidase family protein [Goekera deserti]
MTSWTALLGTTRRRLVAAGTVVVLALAVLLAVLLPGDEPVTRPTADPTPTTASASPAVPDAPPETPAATFPTTVAAAVVDEVDVFAGPDAGAAPVQSLDAGDQLSGQLTFVVDSQQGDWLQVQLPTRPNGSTGWVRAADMSLTSHDYSIEVRLAEHRMLVRQADAVLLDTPVGVGAADAPTPGGTYYLKELLQPPDPDGGYGPYAYGLSGFSTVFTSYSGGEGVIGIHGTDAPETVGTDVSDGCIRVTNEVVRQMVEDIGLPLGTRVTITA